MPIATVEINLEPVHSWKFHSVKDKSYRSVGVSLYTHRRGYAAVAWFSSSIMQMGTVSCRMDSRDMLFKMGFKNRIYLRA
ncbi:Uncharacterised protein [Hafnia alvei]|uniref:Uncharacterized protein n=1 Tax=Hafnia alvei TaxID=569 RepID=A0A377PIK0_HAFAL|nr:Uncharacterised protein [Hafnia alvei]